jgi:hypothetical protein
MGSLQPEFEESCWMGRKAARLAVLGLMTAGLLCGQAQSLVTENASETARPAESSGLVRTGLVRTGLVRKTFLIPPATFAFAAAAPQSAVPLAGSPQTPAAGTADSSGKSARKPPEPGHELEQPEAPAEGVINPDSALPTEEAAVNREGMCLEPPPMVRMEDYTGPLQKTVGIFARKLDHRSAVRPRFKGGTALCTLDIPGKFKLFRDDTLDPISFLTSAFNAGLNQWGNADPTYGQGTEGYTKRLAAELAGDTAGRFLSEFALPTVFGEDPRYYRLAQGSFGKRLAHAAEHVVIAHRDSGVRMLNFSEWTGAAGMVAFNYTIHHGTERSWENATLNLGLVVAQDMAYDVLREFWPEMARKLHMPFRGLRSAVASGAISTIR